MNQCVNCGDYSEELSTVLVAEMYEDTEFEEMNLCPECLDTFKSDPDFDVAYIPEE